MAFQPNSPNPTKESDAERGWWQQVAIYGAAGLAGLGAAINSIRHNFYEEAKTWDGLSHFREERIRAQQALKISSGENFSDYIREYNKIEKQFTEDFSAALKETRGIESRGWRGYTVGTVQQWQASGPHTRMSAVFNTAATVIISLGALLALKQSNHISNALDAQANNQSQQR